MAKHICFILIKSLVLTGSLILLHACTVKPAHRDFVEEEVFPEKYAAEISSLQETQIRWQDSFPSNKLLKDIKAVTQNNNELEAALSRIDKAVAEHQYSHGEFFPSVYAGADFFRSKVDNSIDTNYSGTGNALSINALMNWDLDIWGALKAKEKASLLSVREQKALADKKMLDVQTLLVESWVNFQISKKLEQTLLEQQKTSRKFLDLTKTYFKQGLGTSSDILLQRSNLLAIEKMLPKILSETRRSSNSYAVIMGNIPEARSITEEELPLIDKLTQLPPPLDLFKDRPDLRAAFFSLQAADNDFAASVLERLPTISVGISYGKNRQSFSSVETETISSFSGSLLAPLFDAGRLKARMNQKKAETFESLAMLKQAVLEALEEVENSIELEHSLFDRHRLLNSEIVNAQKGLDSAKLFYQNGKETYLNVLSSLINLQKLEIEEIELREALLLNRCRLLRALGSRWSI